MASRRPEIASIIASTGRPPADAAGCPDRMSNSAGLPLKPRQSLQ